MPEPATTEPATALSGRWTVALGQLDDDLRARAAAEKTRHALSLIHIFERLCGDAEAATLLDGLAADQRRALRAHVIDDEPYGDIAVGLRCSQSVVRKRVSRGLAQLRLALGEGADAAA